MVAAHERIGRTDGRERDGVAERPAFVWIALGGKDGATLHARGHGFDASHELVAVIVARRDEQAVREHERDFTVDELAARRLDDERATARVRHQEMMHAVLGLELQRLVDDRVDGDEVTLGLLGLAKREVRPGPGEEATTHEVPLRVPLAHPLELGGAQGFVGPQLDVSRSETARARRNAGVVGEHVGAWREEEVYGRQPEHGGEDQGCRDAERGPGSRCHRWKLAPAAAPVVDAACRFDGGRTTSGTRGRAATVS